MQFVIALCVLMQKIGNAILALAEINKEPNDEKIDQLNFEQFFSAIQTKITVDNLQAVFFVALYRHSGGNTKDDSLSYDQVMMIIFMTWNSDLSACTHTHTHTHTHSYTASSLVIIVGVITYVFVSSSNVTHQSSVTADWKLASFAPHRWGKSQRSNYGST